MKCYLRKNLTNTGWEHSVSRSSKDNRGVGLMGPWWLDEDALCAELFQLLSRWCINVSKDHRNQYQCLKDRKKENASIEAGPVPRKEVITISRIVCDYCWRHYVYQIFLELDQLLLKHLLFFCLLSIDIGSDDLLKH